MPRPGLLLLLIVTSIILVGCCGSENSRKCDQVDESQEAARRGWHNAHSATGFIAARPEFHDVLHIGAAQSTIRSELGKPAAVDSLDGRLRWWYASDSTGTFAIHFRDDVVVDWSGRSDEAP